jgi:phosphoribosylformylglycinamidine synthase
MLSESQERMAFIVKSEGLDTVLDVFRKYEVSFGVIGKVDDSKILKVNDGSERVVNIPAKALSESPIIKREEKRPNYLDKLLDQKKPKRVLKLEDIFYKLIASENICSKEWIYRQYDHEVGVRSVVKCGEGDSGVLRIIGTNKFIASSVGVNSKHCFLDPYEGAKGGLVEQCDNVIANGAKPLAMVNCCNFGNPEIPESFWYFSKSIEGINDFCRSLRIPIVGGNVSFYNEDEVKKTAIKATPVIMIVGLIYGQENIITLPFKKVGNEVLIIGETYVELGGSEYYASIYHMEGGIPPKVNEKDIKKRWDYVFELYKNKYIQANHDVDKGGFIITIAEMCFKNRLGVTINTKDYNRTNLSDDELLFSESVGRFIIEISPKDHDKVIELAKRFGVYVQKLGTITDIPEIHISGIQEKNLMLDLNKMKNLYNSTIPNMMDI